MTTYRVQVTREGRWWMVHVPDIDGLTQARRLAEVEPMARSLVAITLDVDPDSFDLSIETTSIDGVEVADRLAHAREDQRKAEELTAAAAAEVRAIARDLAGKGVPLRDIGVVLGVSHQRAQQLIAS